MEYVLNELSLCGQYENGDQFATRGMTPLLGVLKVLSSFGVNDILKKSSFFNSEVADGVKLFELTQSRMSPAVLAVCSQLSRMQREPYWDSESAQESDKHKTEIQRHISLRLSGLRVFTNLESARR
jgi:hypothetical protein